MNEIDLEKAQREEVRWRILRVLDAGRPLPIPESLILRTLQEVNLPVTSHGLRRELTYLQERALVKVSGRDSPTWLAGLTRHGVDLVEYTIECLPGIARPPKFL